MSPLRVPINLEIGKMIRKYIDSVSERIAFVVSGDLSHCHAHGAVDAIYMPVPGANMPKSEKADPFDEAIENWLKTMKEDYLLKEACSMVPSALSCGFDGLVILHGVMSGNEKENKFKTTFLVRKAPTYFGMAVAVISKE